MYQSIRYTTPQLRALYVLAAVVVALCHLAYDLGVRASVHRPALVAFVTRYARTSAAFAIGFARGLITPEAAEQPTLSAIDFDLHIADDAMVDAFLASNPLPPRDAYDLEPVAPAIATTPITGNAVLDAFFSSIPDEPVTAPDVPFTLKALRAECLRLGLPTYGTKAQLAERLAAPF